MKVDLNRTFSIDSYLIKGPVFAAVASRTRTAKSCKKTSGSPARNSPQDNSILTRALIYQLQPPRLPDERYC